MKEITPANSQPESRPQSPDNGRPNRGYPLWRLLVFLGFIVIILAVYSFERLEFLLVNRRVFAAVSSGEILRALLMGIRFDLSFVLTLASPFLLITLLPYPWRWSAQPVLPRWFPALFLAVNAPWLAINFADAHYFRFSGRRSGLEVLALGNDLFSQAGQLLRQYWFVPVVTAVCLLLLHYLLTRLIAAELWQRRVAWPVWCLIAAGAIGATVIGNRGGLQSKPLRPSHAYIFSEMALGDAALSTPYVLMRTKLRESVPTVRFFAADSDVDRLVERDRKPLAQLPPTRDNVVIIILESFGREFMGAPNGRSSLMPFFAGLSRRGLFFSNGFANGRRSIEAPPAILAGIPALMDAPYVTSRYVGNRIHGIGEVLAGRGYRTMFFHGGKNGTMFFDLMSRLCGFDEYYGKNEYPGEQDYDGAWGIYDEPFLRFVRQKLDASPEPFATTIFTLSSHNPFLVPADFASRVDPNLSAFQRSLVYTDHALAEFFRQAEQSPWYRNTLFVLSADHTAESTDPAYQNEQGRFRVPLLFFHGGGRIAPEQSTRVAQHVDIFPSIIDFLGIRADEVGFPMLPFGQSVFDKTRPGQAINQTSGLYWLLRNDKLVSLRLADQAASGDPALLDVLRAYIQFYNNGLNDQSWFNPVARTGADILKTHE